MLHVGLGTWIHLSSAHHPQINGQTEQTNVTLEQYLCPYIIYQQDLWAFQLLLSQFAYNNAVHAPTQKTLFIATYGQSTNVSAADLQELYALQDLFS